MSLAGRVGRRPLDVSRAAAYRTAAARTAGITASATTSAAGSPSAGIVTRLVGGAAERAAAGAWRPARRAGRRSRGSLADRSVVIDRNVILIHARLIDRRHILKRSDLRGRHCRELEHGLIVGRASRGVAAEEAAHVNVHFEVGVDLANERPVESALDPPAPHSEAIRHPGELLLFGVRERAPRVLTDERGRNPHRSRDLLNDEGPHLDHLLRLGGGAVEAFDRYADRHRGRFAGVVGAAVRRLELPKHLDESFAGDRLRGFEHHARLRVVPPKLRGVAFHHRGQAERPRQEFDRALARDAVAAHSSNVENLIVAKPPAIAGRGHIIVDEHLGIELRDRNPPRLQGQERDHLAAVAILFHAVVIAPGRHVAGQALEILEGRLPGVRSVMDELV